LQQFALFLVIFKFLNCHVNFALKCVYKFLLFTTTFLRRYLKRKIILSRHSFLTFLKGHEMIISYTAHFRCVDKCLMSFVVKNEKVFPSVAYLIFNFPSNFLEGFFLCFCQRQLGWDRISLRNESFLLLFR
jgi:hypothetical protein